MMNKEKDPKEHKDSFAKGIMFGTLIGAVLGILYAPKAGEKTRIQLKTKTDKLKKAGIKHYEDIMEQVEPIIDEVKTRAQPVIDKVIEETPVVIDKIKTKTPEVMETIQDEIAEAKKNLEQLEKQKNKLKKNFFKKLKG